MKAGPQPAKVTYRHQHIEPFMMSVLSKRQMKKVQGLTVLHTLMTHIHTCTLQ